MNKILKMSSSENTKDSFLEEIEKVYNSTLDLLCEENIEENSNGSVADRSRGSAAIVRGRGLVDVGECSAEFGKRRVCERDGGDDNRARDDDAEERASGAKKYKKGEESIEEGVELGQLREGECGNEEYVIERRGYGRGMAEEIFSRCVASTSNEAIGSGTEEQNFDEGAMGKMVEVSDGDVCERAEWSDIVSEVSRIKGDFKRRIIHDVIAVPESKDMDKLIAEIIAKGKKRNVLFVCEHRYNESDIGKCNGYGQQHVHFVHDCPWINHECRCFRLSVLPRAQSYDTNQSIENVLAYFAALLHYYQKEERQLVYVKVGSRNWGRTILSEQCRGVSSVWHSATRGIFGGNKVVQSERYRWCEIRGTPQESDSTVEVCMSKHARYNISGISSIINKDGATNESARSYRKSIPGNICAFILQHPTFPLQAIMSSTIWHNHPEFKYLLASDKCVQRGINNALCTTSKWDIRQFLQYYGKVQPLFCAINGDLTSYYYTIDESVEYLSTLLIFQLNSSLHTDYIEVKSFLQDLFNVCEKKLPKRNAFCLVSPPSAGKNWFIDAVATFYLNVGNIANFNRSNAFPFEDCINRRLLIWNEINFMPSALDTIKMLLAGDTMAVNIKFSAHKPLFRTPVIIMSNTNRLNNSAFIDRVFFYRWRSAPYLKEYAKKPHPLAWPKLLEKYNIIQIID